MADGDGLPLLPDDTGVFTVAVAHLAEAAGKHVVLQDGIHGALEVAL